MQNIGHSPLSNLSDSELVGQFRDLTIEETQNLAQQLEHIAEMERRKYFLHYSSLWSYLIHEHGMEESTAERRIKAARMLVRFPEIKGKLESGALNLTLLEIARSYAHREKLSDPELSDVLTSITGLSCKAAARELASQFPESSTEVARDRIRPISAELSQVTFVAPHELIEKLDEIKGLLAHSHPGITLAPLIDLMATNYSDRYSPEAQAKRAEHRAKVRGAKTRATDVAAQKQEQEEQRPKLSQRPESSECVESPSSPTVKVSSSHALGNAPEKPLSAPDAHEHGGEDQKRTLSKTQIYELINTKGYQCSFVDQVTRQQCQSKYGLEIHHIQPFSYGGRTKVQNATYLCIAHHARVSFLQFGERSKYFKRRE